MAKAIQNDIMIEPSEIERQRDIKSAIGVAALAAFNASPSMETPTEEVAPITPDQYIEEMWAMGWTCYAGFLLRADGSEWREGVIERVNDAVGWHSSPENLECLRRLRWAISASGHDFFHRVADRLNTLGFRENVRTGERFGWVPA